MRRVEKEEINRKLLHVLAVGFPVFIYFGPSWFQISRNEISWMIFALFLFSLGLDLFRLWGTSFKIWFFERFGSMMRVQEESQLTGATYIVAGSCVCSFISTIDEGFAASAFLSLTLFILGDAAAALCGKAFGKYKIGGKTLEGSLGCFLFCALLTTFVFPTIPTFLKNWNGDFTWFHMLIFPFAVTFLELFPIKFNGFSLNDNLYVPAVVTLLVLIG